MDKKIEIPGKSRDLELRLLASVARQQAAASGHDLVTQQRWSIVEDDQIHAGVRPADRHAQSRSLSARASPRARDPNA